MTADLWISLDKRQLALNAAMDVCHSLNIRAAFFFTAQPAHMYPDEIQKMPAQGHEIGCHGLTHGDEENYDRMPEEMQRSYIAQVMGRTAKQRVTMKFSAQKQANEHLTLYRSLLQDKARRCQDE